MEAADFKLDRTAFHAGTHSETEKYYSEMQPKTGKERLEAANYLNSVAFQFDLKNPPKMDRTAFSARKHKL